MLVERLKIKNSLLMQSILKMLNGAEQGAAKACFLARQWCQFYAMFACLSGLEGGHNDVR